MKGLVPQDVRAYPVSWTEVYCLSKIEAKIEARVVGSRKCNHELPGMLIHPVYLKDEIKEILKI